MKKYLLPILLALPALLPAQTPDPTFCRELLGKANAALAARDWNKARDYCETALPLCPGIADSLDAVMKKATEGVEKQKKDAEDARDAAKRSEEFAKKKKQEADAERNKATAALAELEKSRFEVIKFLSQKANGFVLNLQYDSALVVINDMAKLVSESKAAPEKLALEKQKVANALLEIAFWHSEAGNSGRAVDILETAAALVNNSKTKSLLANLPAEPAAARLRLREAMQALDATHFDFLFKIKYYPDMVPVEGGKFMMGCDRSIDDNCANDETLHEQEVSSFKIARTETTVWQFALYCYANADKGLYIKDFLVSTWSDPGNNPVVNVHWYHAVEYANWVSSQKGLNLFYEVDKETQDPLNTSKYLYLKWTVGIPDKTRNSYRLPTEAEWEYAAKGGNNPDNTLYSGSNDPDLVAWYDGNSGSRTQPVGSPGKKPNGLGLYDMSGNVWEWCWDWYGAYETSPEKNYNGPPEGRNRVLRGGSWSYVAGYCRAAGRSRDYPDFRFHRYGFRLVSLP